MIVDEKISSAPKSSVSPAARTQPLGVVVELLGSDKAIFQEMQPPASPKNQPVSQTLPPQRLLNSAGGIAKSAESMDVGSGSGRRSGGYVIIAPTCVV